MKLTILGMSLLVCLLLFGARTGVAETSMDSFYELCKPGVLSVEIFDPEGQLKCVSTKHPKARTKGPISKKEAQLICKYLYRGELLFYNFPRSVFACFTKPKTKI